MSQDAVRKLLVELGGKARSSEISKLALERYPGFSLHFYVSIRLRQMEKWGEVRLQDGYWILSA